MPEEKEEKAQWELIQAKTFTKWCNMYLKRKNHPIITGPINEAWDNGIKLMQLVNALYDVPMPKKYKKPKKCKLEPQKLDNITLARDMLEDKEKAGVKTNFLKNTDLLKGNWKMILGMVWAIILDFNIKGLGKDENKNAKQGLLIWVRKKVEGYKGIKKGNPTNFSSNWKDGKIFAALVHKHYPEKLDYDNMKDGDAKDLTEEAFAQLEALGVERLLDVEDVCDVPKPDEKSVMTYVFEIYKVLSATDMKEKSAQHIKNFLEFLRNVRQLQSEYEERATKWTESCDQQVKEFEEAKEADSASGAAEVLNAYKKYILEVQPKMIAEKIELEELYTNIQSQLKVNKRAAWACDESVAPENLEATAEKLNAAQKKHYETARECRFNFVEAMKPTEISEDQVKEWNDAFDHFDENKNDYMEFDEFSAALKAVGVPLTEEAEKKAFKGLCSKVEIDDNPVKVECVNRQKFLGFLENMYTAKDTPASIIASMDMVGGGEGTSAKLTEASFKCPPLDEEDQEFIKKYCPKNEDGTYNFAQFTKDQFGESGAVERLQTKRS